MRQNCKCNTLIINASTDFLFCLIDLFEGLKIPLIKANTYRRFPMAVGACLSFPWKAKIIGVESRYIYNNVRKMGKNMARAKNFRFGLAFCPSEGYYNKTTN